MFYHMKDTYHIEGCSLIHPAPASNIEKTCRVCSVQMFMPEPNVLDDKEEGDVPRLVHRGQIKVVGDDQRNSIA